MIKNNEIVSNNMDKNRWKAPQVQRLNVKDTKDGSQTNGNETWNAQLETFTKGAS